MTKKAKKKSKGIFSQHPNLRLLLPSLVVSLLLLLMFNNHEYNNPIISSEESTEINLIINPKTDIEPTRYIPLRQEYEREFNITGYYQTYKGEAWGEVANCNSILVTGGDTDLINEFKSDIENGNTVNKLDYDNNLIMNIEIPSDQHVAQKIKQSYVNNQIELVVKRKMPTDTAAEVCYSFVDIISVH